MRYKFVIKRYQTGFMQGEFKDGTKLREMALQLEKRMFQECKFTNTEYELHSVFKIEGKTETFIYELPKSVFS